MAIVRSAWLSGLLLISLCSAAQTSRTKLRTFDPPLKKKVVDYGPSPYYEDVQNVRIRLTCFYFPGFVVKQYDEGQKGAEWLAILTLKAGTARSCMRSHQAGEKVIEPGGGDGWSGYFKGVKNKLVFFDAADGVNGGLPFAVYDSDTGTKVFEDSAYEASMWNIRAGKETPFDHLSAGEAEGGGSQLRYLRVVEADCDLHGEKDRCWQSVKEKPKLKGGPMPICSGYADISERRVSVIAYPVEVSLKIAPNQDPVVTNVAGAEKCWPVE